MNEQKLLDSGIVFVTNKGKVFLTETGKEIMPKNNGNGSPPKRKNSQRF